MLLPLQITSQDISLTEAIEAKIRKKAEKLEHFYPTIVSCRVTIKVPNKHHHKGRIYNVRIDLKVPNNEIAITKEKEEDLYAAIRDAFTAAKRKLENFAQFQRGDVKKHEAIQKGYISELVKEEDFGFIKSLDGNDTYYFHSTNVKSPAYKQLKVGIKVQFLVEQGTEGPHAVRVSAYED